jgi:desulfoferrodoxin-like iron-binding protein
MSKKAEVYKCESCGMVVTILKDGEGRLSCCDKEMQEVTPDEAKRLSYGMQRPGTP